MGKDTLVVVSANCVVRVVGSYASKQDVADVATAAIKAALEAVDAEKLCVETASAVATKVMPADAVRPTTAISMPHVDESGRVKDPGSLS